jgi:hypothetical protein
MLAFMNEIADIEPKRFATYFGAESSAAYRWMRPDARPSSTVTRLMHFLKTALLMQDAAGRTQLLEDWRKTVEQEARNRGVDDVFKTGRWTTPILDNGAPSSPQAPCRSRQRRREKTPQKRRFWAGFVQPIRDLTLPWPEPAWCRRR